MGETRTLVTARLALVTAESHEERWDVLVGRMAQGDQSALARFYDATAPAVHALVGRIVRDAAIAEEVTGDVFFQAWQQAGRYDADRGAPLAWLLAMARTRAIDRIRVGVAARVPHEPVEEAHGIACARPGPEDSYSTDEWRRRVVAALALLPAEQREAVELAYYEGLSHSEVAARLDQPLGTVKTRIRLGMSKLRDALGSLGSVQ
jgi:RNA polymerase sigma-70 factor, ECF subfamily